MNRMLLAFLLLAAAFPATLAAQSVQLSDGRVLLAEVETGSVTGEGMRVRRLDNGGVLDLRWDHLTPASAMEWKKRFDLAGDAQDEITVRADEVTYEIGGTRRSVLGRIVDQTADSIVVQQKGVPSTVKRRDVVGVRKVDAPVTQVMTREEYYGDLLQQAQPGADADKHLLVAETLMKVRDYDRAIEHVEKAKAAGNSKNPPQIDAMLGKLQRYKEAQKELKLLEDIQAARSRGGVADFEKGGKLIAQFEKEFPQTKLKSEFDAEKRRFAEARTRFLTGQVAEKFRDGVRVVADKSCGDATTTLQAARDFATAKMSDEIFARVAQQLRLDVAEVKTLWAARKDNSIGRRVEHYGYGVGSWVLGEQAILKDTTQGKANAAQKARGGDSPAAAGGNPQLDRLAKLLRQAQERRNAQQSQGGQEREQTDEDWWREAERVDRAGFLRAYYAEFGGQMTVTFATVSPCISCSGEGTVPELGGDGRIVRNKCFLCHGTKWLRSFKAY
ncbi:MAG: hypothetical protein FJ306_08580 [Planctomycetes bacterium]|nr:hypothetical protein [Planctomycetota bacterium]